MKKLKIIFYSILLISSTNILTANNLLESPFKKTNNQKIQQSTTLQEGNWILSGGLGAPNFIKIPVNFRSSYLTWTGKFIGPVHAKIEYMTTDKVGIGLTFNGVSSYSKFTATNGVDTFSTTLDHHALAFNLRFNYHFYTENNFDLYFGGGLGYNTGEFYFSTNDPLLNIGFGKSVFPISMDFTFGMRYFILDFLGIYAEVGIAKSIVQAGVALKI